MLGRQRSGTKDLEEVKALLEALEEGEEGPSKTEMMARLADFLLVAAVVDEPRLVLETAWGTLAVAKVSELGGSEMEVPGGAEVAFPAGTGDLAGAAHIKVVAFKGNPYLRATDVECRDRNDAGNLVTLAGVEDPNCKEPLAAAVLSIDLGKRVDNLEEPIVFTLAIDNVHPHPGGSSNWRKIWNWGYTCVV